MNQDNIFMTVLDLRQVRFWAEVLGRGFGQDSLIHGLNCPKLSTVLNLPTLASHQQRHALKDQNPAPMQQDLQV